MDFKPNFRCKPLASELTLRPSPEASRAAQAFRGRGLSEAWKVKMPEKVREEAKARILLAGGDPRCWQLVLSESVTYVQWLRVQKVAKAGSKLHTLQAYVLARDQENVAAAAPQRAAPPSQQPTLLRPASTASAGPAVASDQELLIADMEVD